MPVVELNVTAEEEKHKPLPKAGMIPMKQQTENTTTVVRTPEVAATTKL